MMFEQCARKMFVNRASDIRDLDQDTLHKSSRGRTIQSRRSQPVRVEGAPRQRRCHLGGWESAEGGMGRSWIH